MPTRPSSTGSPAFEDVMCTRRDVLRRGALGAGLVGVAAATWGTGASHVGADPAPTSFVPIEGGTSRHITVPEGYRWAPVVVWGDPIAPGAPAFVAGEQTAASQSLQLGYGADFVGFVPIEPDTRGAAEGAPERALLCVSSEYTNPVLMWPDAPRGRRSLSRARCDADMAAHGLNVAEIVRRIDGGWDLVPRSRYGRRVTAFTPCRVSGPAAGHPLLRTTADPSGKRVLGTVSNCSGGLTPWGTWLQAEENYEGYFAGDDRTADDTLRAEIEAAGIRRKSWFGWERHHPRFDLSQEPNEVFRFGWMVEIDPRHPERAPIKRTALGRFSHESAGITAARDGRVVIYTADDAEFEHIYKYVSHDVLDADDPRSRDRALDEGTLYAARFDANGTGQWLPLRHGEGTLTAEHGFASQADVLIHARTAATHVGATPMDRPEDVQVRPGSAHVYVALTKNKSRKAEQVDAANPRGPNRFGHILELREAERDAGALTFAWDLLLMGGPAPANGDRPGTDVLACPDNLAFDREGNLWVATDGQPKTLRIHDGLYRVPTEGPRRGRPERFLSSVRGAEVCGPCFTPDQRTLFVAIQHPGSGGTFEEPAAAFPPSDRPGAPRPGVIAIWRDDGGPIGA